MPGVRDPERQAAQQELIFPVLWTAQEELTKEDKGDRIEDNSDKCDSSDRPARCRTSVPRTAARRVNLPPRERLHRVGDTARAFASPKEA